jgi:LmbE family N-acetylglucosaminyl deacetylase
VHHDKTLLDMRKLLILLFLSSSLWSFSQDIPEWSSAEILHEMRQLNQLSRVMYVAAHPDDENTRMIAWLSNVEGVRTSYLSLTRGDGGQNLMGPEKGDELGIIRSQELLRARSVDGGEQFFTRAIDFGYSKRADEVLEFWDEKEVLSDVVRAIRIFKPNVIITRFPPTKRAGHGMHTASAMLAESAFDLAADPEYAPDQVEEFGVWQVERLYFNTSTWWYPELAEQADTSKDLVKVDIGAFIPELGVSSGVLAGNARSMHKSQGFGSSLQRGERTEYLQYVKGSRAEGHILDGLVHNWSEAGHQDIEDQISAMIQAFDPLSPEKSIGSLSQLHQLVSTSSWVGKDYILEQINSLLLSCSGTWFEFRAGEERYSPGTQVSWDLNLVVQREIPVSLLSLNVDESFECPAFPEDLGVNKMNRLEGKLLVPDRITQDYWLNSSQEFMYEVEADSMLCMPASAAPLKCTVELLIGSTIVQRTIPLTYKWTDRVKGELRRNVVITPPVSVNTSLDNMIFPDRQSKRLQLEFVYHGDDSTMVAFIPNLDDDWTISPEKLEIEFQFKGQRVYKEIEITPSKKSQTLALKGGFEWNNEILEARSYSSIEYDHFQPQVYQPVFSMDLVRFEMEIIPKRIAYIPGAGDDMVEAIRAMGYVVDVLESHMIPGTDLSQFDVIMCGIRAYNTHSDLYSYHDQFMQFVADGGTFIVQYNTSRGVDAERIGPYEFKLSRDRVSEEDAAVTILDADHPLLNKPNKITEGDFDAWKQERGLYFPGEWSDEYSALLSWNDQDEDPKKGALITAEYGEGVFIYTGISFFRQLPAAVPGAYRLLANLISAENE